MMLVDADRVEPAGGGIFQFVHEVVVHVMRTLRVEQRGMDVHPHRGMLFGEIRGQFGVMHEMEPHEFHRVLRRPSSPWIVRSQALEEKVRNTMICSFGTPS